MTFNVLLGEPSKLGHVGCIENILDLTIDDGCAPDHVTSDLLVRAFCNAGRDEEACNIFFFRSYIQEDRKHKVVVGPIRSQRVCNLLSYHV